MRSRRNYIYKTGPPNLLLPNLARNLPPRIWPHPDSGVYMSLQRRTLTSPVIDNPFISMTLSDYSLRSSSSLHSKITISVFHSFQTRCKVSWGTKRTTTTSNCSRPTAVHSSSAPATSSTTSVYRISSRIAIRYVINGRLITSLVVSAHSTTKNTEIIPSSPCVQNQFEMANEGRRGQI